MTRKKAVLITVVISIVLGVPSSLGNGVWANIQILGMDFLSFFDFFSNNIIMPIVALCTCLLIGWVVGPKIVTDEITRNGEKMRRKGLYWVMIKFVAPILLVMILISSILQQLGIISI